MKKINVETKIREWIRFFKYREKLEAGLDPFLSFFALELQLHAPMEVAFRRACARTPQPLRGELEKVFIHAHGKGNTLELALVTWAQAWNHPPLTRAVTLVNHIAKQGSTETAVSGIQRLAEDLRMQQQTVLKRFSSALTMYALLFIGVSAVVPALFLAFITIGSRFLELTFTPTDVMLVAMVGFPLADAFILTLVWVQTPPALRQSSSEEVPSPNPRFRAWNPFFFSTPEGKALLRTSVVEGASLFLVGWCAYLYYHLPPFTAGILVVGLGLAPLAGNILWREYAFDAETARMVRMLPDSLILAAALPTTLSFEQRLVEVARTTPPPLHGEWVRVTGRITKGDAIPDSLSVLGENRPSPAFEKVRHLLARAYESGWSLAHPASALAHELLTTHSLVEERRAVLLVEKYTLLAAGGVIVPLLLGVMLGVMHQLPAASDTTLGIGSTSTSISDIIPFAVHGYLFVYAILAGLFVGLLDGSRMQGAGCAAVLVPLSQVVLLAGEWGIGHG